MPRQSRNGRSSQRAEQLPKVEFPVFSPGTADEDIIRMGRQLAVKHMLEIIVAMIDRARRGSRLHAKFVFDFAGIATAQQDNRDDGESLASFLLKELDLEAKKKEKMTARTLPIRALV